MPQFCIEFSRNISDAFDARKAARRIHEELAPIIRSDLSDFKTRLSELDDLLIGDGSERHAMIHLDLRMLSGRTAEQKQAAGKAALAAAREALSPNDRQVQITVEVRDLDAANYHKVVIDRA